MHTHTETPPREAVALEPVLVFLAEDDPELRKLAAEALQKDGHEVHALGNGLALFLDLLTTFDGAAPHARRAVVVSDIRMPGSSGLDVLRAIRAFPWCPPFILLTGFGDPATHARAHALGASAVLDKPVAMDELRSAVAQYARS